MTRAVAIRNHRFAKNRSAGRAQRRKKPQVSVNLFAWILAIFSFMLGCLLYVQARTTVINERYKMEEAQRILDETKAENRKLRIAWSTLTSPKQIQRTARKSQFHYPTAEEVVHLP